MPPIAAPCRGDNRTMIRYVVDVGATNRHSFSVELRIERPGFRAAPEPAGLDSGQLPGARVRAPPLGADGRAGRRGAAPGAARQGDLAGALRRRRSARRSLPGPRLRHVGARRLPRRARAASSTAPASACASRASEGEPHALALRGLPVGWEVATTLEPRAGRRRARVPRRRLRRRWSTTRSSSAGSGAAASTRPACRTSSSSPAPCPTSTASGCSPTRKRLCEAEIAFWHGTGRAPFERYLFMLNALEDGRGGLEHRSSTALVAPRRDLPRRAAERRQRGEGRDQRRLRRRARASSPTSTSTPGTSSA